MDKPLQNAITQAGGMRALARQIGGISYQAVSHWQRVPPLRVLEIEQITGIPRSVLRPDIYPPEPKRRIK